MERNFETVMIEQCAPVLASLKPADFSATRRATAPTLPAASAAGTNSWDEKGLVCPPSSRADVRTHRYLVYVYRESKLRAVLAQRRCGISCARKLHSA